MDGSREGNSGKRGNVEEEWEEDEGRGGNEIPAEPPEPPSE